MPVYFPKSLEPMGILIIFLIFYLQVKVKGKKAENGLKIG
jgi:hypothetical protein